MVELGFLRKGDTYIFENHEYKVLGLGNRGINNVQCINVNTNKRKWFDLDTEVEVKKDNK